MHGQRPVAGTRNNRPPHNNASPDKAKVTESYLQEQNFQVSDHPPYSTVPYRTALPPVNLDPPKKKKPHGGNGDGKIEGYNGLGPLKSRHIRAQSHNCFGDPRADVVEEGCTSKACRSLVKVFFRFSSLLTAVLGWSSCAAVCPVIHEC